MLLLKTNKVKRVTPCTHKCKNPVPATVFVKFHPFKDGWEIRKCFHCQKLSAYSTIDN